MVSENLNFQEIFIKILFNSQINKIQAQRRLMLIVIGALSSLTFVAISYKMVVSPYFKQKRSIRNEEFANYIFEHEKISKHYEPKG